MKLIATRRVDGTSSTCTVHLSVENKTLGLLVRAYIIPGFAALTLGTTFGCTAGTSTDTGPDPVLCGNGSVDLGETCDDSNTVAGDGCASNCLAIEPGYTCPQAGAACEAIPTPLCGNRTLDAGEVCDDGNATSGDGCAANCLAIEPGFTCPQVGTACEGSAQPVCGNGVREGAEACDDNNTVGTDGCAADCLAVEAGSACPSEGGACVTVGVCGNGLLETPEACDDRNTASSDGCLNDCTEVEAGWGCPLPGEACVLLGVCGNGLIESGEACDDFNTLGSDGCSADCAQIEAGFACSTAGSACIQLRVCGNGLLEAPEVCDDGNAQDSDGCSADCSTVESGFVCPTEQTCVPADVCGNGIVETGELCDDGNTFSNDGCTRDCAAIESGFLCPEPGARCVAATGCGNGIIDDGEACDDGNTLSLDGCANDCSAVENGFICTQANIPCVRESVCGNGILDATEACDDDNTFSSDGCSADCSAIESGYSCPTEGQACEPLCGNGQLDSGEVCDDSNTNSGDGCNVLCTQVEPGFECSQAGQPCVSLCGNNTVDSPPEACDDGNTLTETACAYGVSTCTACDATCQNEINLIGPSCGDGNVDAGEEACDDGNSTTETECPYGQGVCALCDATCQTVLNLTGPACGDGNVDAGEEACDDGNTDTETSCGYGEPTCTACDATCQSVLNLTGPACGDGNVDSAAGEVCDDGNSITETDCPAGVPTCTACNATCDTVLNLPGPNCGDGVVNTEVGEVCDDGNSITETECPYGVENCTLCDATCENVLSLTGGTCGDSVVNGPEACDDGVNNGDYGGCNADCLSRAPFCGDAIIDAPLEFCDDGTNDSSYGSCTPDCLSQASHCGDNVVNAPFEDCDDGINAGAYGGCGADCRLAARCGDGVTDLPYESCDNGVNDGSYGTCLATCRLAPFCGDGRLSVPQEACDDGMRCSVSQTTCRLDAECPTGESCVPQSGDGCAANCSAIETGYSCPTAGAACEQNCGNGQFDAGEACDDGNAVITDGCANCTITTGYECPVVGSTCNLLCSNGRIDSGEACDDGNTIDPDGCSADCSTIAAGYECPTPGTVCNLTCGNGTADLGEECDFGTALNDGSYGGCTASCVRASYCGDGFLDAAQEECDNGTASNDGSYGGCRPTCTLAPYCGDAVVTAPQEQCDDGNTQSTDGCDSSCTLEAGYVCPVAGATCNDKCGNGTLDADEACDDGNRTDGDGCDATCTRVESGWDCPIVGSACVAARCGDGIVVGAEACDDANSISGDGCSKRCQLEEGYHCPNVGLGCEVAVCSNGVVEGLETCDDGGLCTGDNTTACTADSDCSGVGGTCTARDSDGCSTSCKLEIGFKCPTPGTACSTTTCGDGVIEGAEQCDEGVATPSGGCDSNCQIVEGFACPVAGSACFAITCGDGVVQGLEECDDGGLCTGVGVACSVDSDCGAGEKCFLDQCRASCTADAQCGGSETCEPRAGDGCNPACKTENIFACDSTGSCDPECGDGVTLAAVGEECDDGNTVSGDGCSAVCTVETGYTCTDFTLPSPSSISVPITYRDFLSTHPDMQNGCPSPCDVVCGMVETTLNSDGNPVYSGNPRNRSGGASNSLQCGTTTRNDVVTSASTFDQWYKDVPGTNITIESTLTLTEQASGTCSGSGSCSSETTRVDCEANVNGCVWAPDTYQFSSTDFFPLTNLGFGNDGNSKNFHFTSELRAFFRYRGGETLDFFGDDDVWVFINGVLAVDIGGVHPQKPGDITLQSDGYDERFDLYPNGIYELKLFQAERQTVESNYQLTIGGFVNTGTASCDATCGDGVIRGAEACDNGGLCTGDDTTACTSDADCSGVGGTCTARAGDGCDTNCQVEDGYNCTGEASVCTQPVCGDLTLEYPEQCDDGNLSNSDGCSDTCLLESCGDSTVQAGNCSITTGQSCNRDSDCPGGEYCADGETCDDTNTDDFDACTNACQEAVCGDRVVRTEGVCSVTTATTCTSDSDCPASETCTLLEDCDDANGVDTDLCTNNCTQAVCGDGIISLSLGETCDDGVNDGGYGSCLFDCSGASPSCGDSNLDAAYEQCDFGSPSNDGSYGGCRSDCQLAAFCGDSQQSGACSTSTTLACNIDADCPVSETCVATEECDNGVNDGSPGTCNTDCTLPAFCGDSVVATSKGEQCDNGINDGSWAQNQGDSCSPTCQFAPYCGDGFPNAPFEDCDQGSANNIGGYDGCNADCTRAAYCGDGFTGICSLSSTGCTTSADCPGGETCNAAPGEACDAGATNNNGAYGGCNPNCTLAAYCGDGNRDFNEQCDLGTSNNNGGYGGCNADCTLPAFCGDGKLGRCSTDNASCNVDGDCAGSQTCIVVETCDDGVNDGAYGGCTASCSAAPACGDGVPGGVCSTTTTLGCFTDGDCPGSETCTLLEACDNGTNDGTYGTCRSNCQLAAFCGDGVIHEVLGGEQCEGTGGSAVFGGRTCGDLDGDGLRESGDFEGGTLGCTSCGLDTSACFRCGDGVRNGFEVCDGTGACGSGADCAVTTCEELGFPTLSGLGCRFDCSYDLTGCDTSQCGNGILEPGEQCDGNLLGGRACNDLDGDTITGEAGDFDGGILTCASDCTLETSACEYCGDGIKNGSELCDGLDTGSVTCVSGSPPLGSFTYQGGTLACNATCDGFDESGCFECNACSDCEEGTCVDGRCGSCRTDADCCAPATCVAGECLF